MIIDKFFHLVNVKKLAKSSTTIIKILFMRLIFACCYHLFNAISFVFSQSDHISFLKTSLIQLLLTFTFSSYSYRIHVKDGFSGKKFTFTQYSNDLKVYFCKNNKWQFFFFFFFFFAPFFLRLRQFLVLRYVNICGCTIITQIQKLLDHNHT